MSRRGAWARGLLVAGLLLALLPVPWPPATVQAAAAPVRWGYYVTYAPSSLATLRARIDAFTHISPWYFELNEDGTLSSTEQPATTALMRSRGVKVLPMVKNVGRYEGFRRTLDTPEKLAAVVETVATVALRPEYDGIHIDFEAISYSERGLLTEFMARLAGRLRPAGKLMTQAVGAQTRDVTSGWSAAYDYAELGKYNDLIVVMAYDWSYPGGEPGPVAPLDWVRRVAGFAGASFGLSTTVLGIPLYGYDWITNRAPRPLAKAVSYDGALDLLTRHAGERGYDEARASEWGRYRVGDEEHEVWFESARSIQAKLEIVRGQGLAGFATWRLGHEDSGFWPLLREFDTPASPVPPVPTTRDRVYFPETRHTLRGSFLTYWRANGGLARFGYPLTEELTEASPEDGQVYTVQYFERARLEYHPHLAGTAHEVLLGHLGRWSMARNGVMPPPPRPPPASDDLYFPETGQLVRLGFRAYWEANGGLAQFGLPLTGEFDERNPEDGQTYTVQYFERARFEYHPELGGTPYEVQLGHLGRQVLRERGWVR